MSIHRSGQYTPDRLEVGWYFFACAVFLSLLLAEYLGPLTAIAFALLLAGSGITLICNAPIPPLPAPGYWLVSILVVGLASAIAANLSGVATLDVNLQRDLGMTISYIVFLMVGQYFLYSRRSLRLLLVAIAAAGLVISIVHLVKASIVLSSGVTDLYLFRLNAGRGSHSQFAAVCACVVLLRDVVARKYRPMILVSAGIMIVSMLLTLSRGLMLDLIILAIAMAGFAATRFGTLIPDILKSVFVILSALAAAVVLYFAVRFTMPPVGQFIDEFFIKLQNSLTEVSGTNLETRNQIMANYRAFELARVMQQFREQSVFVQWLGQGWGSTLEFGFETASSKSTFSRTNAPFLHNGYAYYLMKTGIMGLLLYIVFLSHLALRATASKTWPSADFAVVRRKILLAAVGVLAIDTVTSGGLGFPAIYFGLLTLLAACYGPVWGPDRDEGKPTAAALSRTVNGSLSVKENRWSSADDAPSSLG
jgi:hypothetical protein